MDEERKLIVMVDDDPVILQAGKNILSGKYHVAAVSSARKLFAFLDKNTPDLILLDVMMPEINGYDALETLKAREQTRNIPVIFLTSMDDTDSAATGLFLGAAAYICKPLEPDILFESIVSLLSAKISV